MNLSDRLQCPDCQGHLAANALRELVCTTCDRGVPVADGIIDLTTEQPPDAPRRPRLMLPDALFGPDLPARVRHAAAGRWPASLGDTIELGCGKGEMTEAILADDTLRSLLVLDTDLATLHACRQRTGNADTAPPRLFAAIDPALSVIREAVADTVIGTAALSAMADPRAFLTRLHRLLKAGGRAMFVVPNRRYHQAVALAMAAALTQRYGQTGQWPDGCEPLLTTLARTRMRLTHKDDPALLTSRGEPPLFDRDALEDLGRQIGFGGAEVIPLDPDPSGGHTITRLCQGSGATDDFARMFGPLAATIGRPFLSLLDHQDASALLLLWLTKSTGPTLRVFTPHPSGPPVAYAGPEAVVGGLMPRWSIEMLARDTPDGVLLTAGGWCLSNVDAIWVRITLDSVTRQTPVWRHRTDVHEVLNRANIYHPLNALCSGIGEDLLFADVHPVDAACTLRLEIILAGGLVVTGQTPDVLRMDQQTVVAH